MFGNWCRLATCRWAHPPGAILGLLVVCLALPQVYPTEHYGNSPSDGTTEQQSISTTHAMDNLVTVEAGTGLAGSASPELCDPLNPRCGDHRQCLQSGQCVCDDSTKYGHWAGKNCTECAAGSYGPHCTANTDIGFCTIGVTSERLCRLMVPAGQSTTVKFNYTLQTDPNDPDTYICKSLECIDSGVLDISCHFASSHVSAALPSVGQGVVLDPPVRPSLIPLSTFPSPHHGYYPYYTPSCCIIPASRLVLGLYTDKGKLEKVDLYRDGKRYFRTRDQAMPCGRQANAGKPTLCVDPQNETPCPRANRPGIYELTISVEKDSQWEGVIVISYGAVGRLEPGALCASEVVLLLPAMGGLVFCLAMYISFCYFTRCYNRPCALNDPYRDLWPFYVWAFIEIGAACATVYTPYYRYTAASCVIGVVVALWGTLVVCCRTTSCMTPLYVTFCLGSMLAPIITCVYLVLQEWNKHPYFEDPMRWFQVPLAAGVVQCVSLLAMGLVITSTATSKPSRDSIDYQMTASVAQDDL